MRIKKVLVEKLRADMAKLLGAFESAHGNEVTIGSCLNISPRRIYGWNGETMLKCKKK